MLRAYEYNENIDLTVNHKEPAILLREINLAEQIVKGIQKKCFDEVSDRPCPICGSNQSDFFYTKWNVLYKRCTKCWSIYCDCSKLQRDMYAESKDLIDFRLSEEYQQDAVMRRSATWEETVKWLEFRCFRYLGNKSVVLKDYGNRYIGFINVIKRAEFVSEYGLYESVIKSGGINISNDRINDKADLILYMNALQMEISPENKLHEFRHKLRKGGLLVITSRAGSGFDILSLQENHQYIYPYEHITLPTVKGLIELLQKTGFEVLEVTTPGTMDIGYVYSNKNNIKEENSFLKNMINEHNTRTLQEFQRFLQKNCMSSYVQMIARGI